MSGVSIRNLSKTYGTLPVLEKLSMELQEGGCYCLMGPSGKGKTTLLRLILGLERADSGEIVFSKGKRPRFSAVFQEDRLCEAFSPAENVRLVTGKHYSMQQIQEELAMILPEEAVVRPVSTLSGGMKRRTAIVRAMMAESEFVCMDEPFSGLDEETRKLVIRYVLERKGNRLLLITTHQEEDASLLGAELIQLV